MKAPKRRGERVVVGYVVSLSGKRGGPFHPASRALPGWWGAGGRYRTTDETSAKNVCAHARRLHPAARVLPLVRYVRDVVEEGLRDAVVEAADRWRGSGKSCAEVERLRDSAEVTGQNGIAWEREPSRRLPSEGWARQWLLALPKAHAWFRWYVLEVSVSTHPVPGFVAEIRAYPYASPPSLEDFRAWTMPTTPLPEARAVVDLGGGAKLRSMTGSAAVLAHDLARWLVGPHTQIFATRSRADWERAISQRMADHLLREVQIHNGYPAPAEVRGK